MRASKATAARVINLRSVSHHTLGILLVSGACLLPAGWIPRETPIKDKLAGTATKGPTPTVQGCNSTQIGTADD